MGIDKQRLLRKLQVRQNEDEAEIWQTSKWVRLAVLDVADV
jgi:hypothetical protein